MNIHSTAGIVAAGAYLPAHRLARAEFAGAGARGTRAVASHDEDTTSLGVEAGRRALAGYAGAPLAQLLFATSLPAYADKTNATTVHAALGLPRGCAADDMVGAVRSGSSALRTAAFGAARGAPTLAVCTDIRTGLPGSADERTGGDGAAALLWSDHGPFLAELVGHGAAMAEFLDRWRVPGQHHSHVWEERFGETTYRPLAEQALHAACKDAGLPVDEIDHLAVTGTAPRAIAAATKQHGADASRVVDDRSAAIGVTGAAHPGLLLVDVFEQARPGELIALLTLADGAECLLLRAGDGLPGRRPEPAVGAQLAGPPVGYQDFLVWRGMLQQEPPRRPDPDRPAAPASYRSVDWKFGFTAARCVVCGTRHLPPARVCLHCHAVDRMDAEPLAGMRGTVTTFSVDHLAFSVAPPVIAAVVDFDGGGRIQCQLTDCDAETVAVGDRVELTFRRLYTTADGVHNYFWKARPLRDEEPSWDHTASATR